MIRAPMPADDKNLLAYGDNLDVLRRYVRDESVDLVYLDPPFNSQADYNLLYGQQDGTRAAAQIKAFKDTWRWDQAAVGAYEDVVEAGGDVAQAMRAFRTLLGTSNLLAYLAMMAPRLVELRRVLKPTGSLYLHCDPTASHYLKLLLDAVFGPENFRNEIVWKRTGAHNSAKRYGPVHDVLLFYARSQEYAWKPQFEANPAYVTARYTYKDERGRQFYPVSLLAAGTRRGSSGQTWRGIDVTAKGNHWRYTVERLEKLDASGDIYWPSRGGMPRLKMYAEDAKGALLQDWWDDVSVINSQSAERTGYPTQKPIALLARMILTATEEGDVVLDPFCGCGTAVVAAQRMNRRWIGIDVTHHATALIKNRLIEEHGPGIASSIRVIGEPTAVEDAAVLAADDPFQFQAWALGLVGARPLNGVKKGADRGIDGQLYFHESEGGVTRQILLSVKAGHTGPAHVRDLRGVVQREGADIGVLISLHAPTQAMRAEAADAGFYEFKGSRYPRLQLRSIAELLSGHGVQYPPTAETVFRPTIWPPESIPTVPVRRRRRPPTRQPVGQTPAFADAQAGQIAAESPLARRVREDYERRTIADAEQAEVERERVK